MTHHDMLFAGDAGNNLTTLYDILTKVSQQLETMTKDLEKTKKKLNETQEKLKIGDFTCNTSLTLTFSNPWSIWNKSIQRKPTGNLLFIEEAFFALVKTSLQELRNSKNSQIIPVK